MVVHQVARRGLDRKEIQEEPAQAFASTNQPAEIYHTGGKETAPVSRSYRINPKLFWARKGTRRPSERPGGRSLQGLFRDDRDFAAPFEHGNRTIEMTLLPPFAALMLLQLGRFEVLNTGGGSGHFGWKSDLLFQSPKDEYGNQHHNHERDGNS